MPSVSFVMPHWLYWSGLVIFPLLAMYLARKERPAAGSRTMGVAYFIWLVGGFLGLHRFYLKSLWGLLYLPLFALILYSSSMQRQARLVLSEAKASVAAIDASSTRLTERIKMIDVVVARADKALAEMPDQTTASAKRLQRRIQKETSRRDNAKSRLVAQASERVDLLPALSKAQKKRNFWSNSAYYAFLAIVAFMALDFVLIPRMTRRARAWLEAHPEEPVERELLPDDRKLVTTGWTGAIDRLSLFTGEFVSYWSVIAVFVYYYAVVTRYVFNSPTSWAHESMFLMFGMQYLISGAYALLTDNHVRVDVLYAEFSPRIKAIVNTLTSVFFFIFAGTLLVTGWIFASDSIGQHEVSFTEWGIEYWPVKSTIVIGALLLLLQGIANLAKDIRLIFAPDMEASHGA